MDGPSNTVQVPHSHADRDRQDDWHSVTDAKKRKQIQDRLAQRARRKRLREAKKSGDLVVVMRSPTTDPRPRTTHDQEQNLTWTDDIGHACLVQGGAMPPQDAPFREDALQLAPFSEPNVDGTISSVSTVPSSPPLSDVSPTSTPSQTQAEALSLLGYELPYPLTIFGALFLNGQVLGLRCTTGSPAKKSVPVPAHVPLPLHPTPTQLTTIHISGIDMFPFPQMRDNLISMSALIEEEDFVRDLSIMPSFSIVPGGAPWDPRAWKIERPFADKWGFLLY